LAIFSGARAVSAQRLRQLAHEARALLQSIYDRFAEGFATADVQAARMMLDGLQT
jgi:hypothetical protein